MIAHHPSDALLLDYASGAAAEPVSLLVATHLALCPECRAKVSAFEELGGALIEEADADTETVSASLKGGVLAALDEIDDSAPIVVAPPKPAATADSVAANLPQPVRAYCEGLIERDEWQWAGFGIKKIPLIEGQDEFDCYLLAIREGIKVPQHDHVGNEWTLVLDGGFTDEVGHYARGDMAGRQHGEKHQPVADAGTDCISLIVADAPVALTGPIGRLLNPFMGR